MTQTSISETPIGSIVYSRNGGWLIYGPDPWAWNVSFNCWFSAAQYLKEEGDYPSYVSDTDRETLGMRH